MIANSDTTQTLTLGIAFLALFIGATASLPSTTENVLYTTNTSTTTTKTATAEDVEETNKSAFASQWSISSAFAHTAFASTPKLNPKTMKGSLEEIAAGIDTMTMSEDGQEIGSKTPKEIHQQAQVRAKSSGGKTPVMTSTDKREILWLARIMYSETKRPEEQRLIGWVVRNRVDTGYMGRTYESVAKHSGQFSGLHPYDARYEHNISRWYSSEGQSWETALELAKEIYFADDSERPLALTTRHFYSPHAVSRTPNWAKNQEAVQVIKDPQTDRVRFALYDKIR